MKRLISTLSIGASLAVCAMIYAEAPKSSEQNEGAFLQADTWWNFYFVEGQKLPGRSITAVKVLATDSRRPAWVKITFPQNPQEHMSIFGPAAKASRDKTISLEEVLVEWEDGISEWQTLWVNLHYVSRITKVEQNQ